MYRRLPKVLSIFITKEFLNKLIEDGVNILKDYVDNGYLDQSYIKLSKDE